MKFTDEKELIANIGDDNYAVVKDEMTRQRRYFDATLIEAVTRVDRQVGCHICDMAFEIKDDDERYLFVSLCYGPGTEDDCFIDEFYADEKKKVLGWVRLHGEGD